MPAGFVHLKYGRYDIAQVNTPLSRMVCAIPLLLMEVHEDWDRLISIDGSRAEYPVSEDFIHRNKTSLRMMFFACRLPAIIFSVIGAVSVYAVTRRIYSDRAAVPALAMWCFSPMVLGHAATVNHDVPGAAMLTLAFFCCHHAYRVGELPIVLLASFVAGLALLTRTTNGVIIAYWMSWYLLTPSVFGSTQRTISRFWIVSLQLGVMALILNAGYEFSGSMKPLGQYEFYSKALVGPGVDDHSGNRFSSTCVSSLPIPLPEAFIAGLDLQQRDFESPWFNSYLLGEWRETGWWYYYILAWGMKTPIGFQLVFFVGTAGVLNSLSRRVADMREVLILMTICLVFLLASVKSGFTTHYRYVLPAYPFLAIISSRIWKQDGASNAIQRACSVLLAMGIASSMLCFPHSLSYFNGIVGGPKYGARYLLGSSCDWGQDVYYLEEWLDRDRGDYGDDLFILCNGKVQPTLLGFDKKPMPRRTPENQIIGNHEPVPPGVYVISVSYLYGENSRYHYLQELQPIEQIGYSINVYDLRAPGKCTTNR